MGLLIVGYSIRFWVSYLSFYLGVLGRRRFVTETFVVQDCIKYDTNTYNSNVAVNITLPSEWIITWDSNRKSNSSSNCMLHIGQNSSNQFQCGTYGSGGNNGIQECINGSWQTAQTTSNAPLNTIQNNTMKYENGVLSYSNGSQTVTKTPTISLEKLIDIYATTNGDVKNIKLKQL